jgi:phage baseplate assembly protein gpV
MTSVNTGPNPYSQIGSAYARAAATQPSLANALNAADSGNPPDSNAATNLTLSDAARAQLASTATQKDFSAVTSDARTGLDGLYTAAEVKGPIGDDGKTTIDLSSFDRRALFAIATNNGGKFSPDEQKVANTELGNRFNDVLAPAVATSKLTGDFSSLYKAALDYLDGASGEEKATATWSVQRAAVLEGVQATQQKPTTAPANIANDPVAAYLAQDDDSVTTATADISTVARKVRATLDAQAKAATAAGKELVFDAGRKTGQQADLSSIDNRSLAAISLNQDGLFSNVESYAAKQALDSRSRAGILAALKQSQSSGDPTQLSLGILNTYSSMSAEERQAVNWTPAFRDNAVANYKSSSHILSMLRGM